MTVVKGKYSPKWRIWKNKMLLWITTTVMHTVNRKDYTVKAGNVYGSIGNILIENIMKLHEKITNKSNEKQIIHFSGYNDLKITNDWTLRMFESFAFSLKTV